MLLPILYKIPVKSCGKNVTDFRPVFIGALPSRSQDCMIAQ